MWEAAHLSKYRETERYHILTLPKKGHLAPPPLLPPSLPSLHSRQTGPPKYLNVVQVKDEGDSQNPSYLEPEVTTRFLNQQRTQRPQQTQQPSSKGKKKRNVSGLSPREKVIASRHEEEDEQLSQGAGAAASRQPLPRNFFKLNQPLLLNIGGYLKKSGWVNINSQRSSFGSTEEPELVRELHDLHVSLIPSSPPSPISPPLPRASLTALWMSSTAVTLSNMFPLGMALLRPPSEVHPPPSLPPSDAFLEWHRVLKPDGLLLVAVPDMAVLARSPSPSRLLPPHPPPLLRLILDPTLSVNERFFVMKMIYGAQSDTWDYHMVLSLPSFSHSL
jgi:hypothetical protein